MSGGNDVPVGGESLPERVEEVLVKHDCLLSVKMPTQLVKDVKKVGWEKAKYYVCKFSPSQLGREGLIGLRRLAQVRRDYPEVFPLVIESLDEIFGGGGE